MTLHRRWCDVVSPLRGSWEGLSYKVNGIWTSFAVQTCSKALCCVRLFECLYIRICLLFLAPTTRTLSLIVWPWGEWVPLLIVANFHSLKPEISCNPFTHNCNCTNVCGDKVRDFRIWDIFTGIKIRGYVIWRYNFYSEIYCSHV